MGDENPIRTLGDYSKPSHEGYRNTIELPVGNNVVPLRFDTIWLVQNGCSFYGLRSKDPNQHLKDFLKLVDSRDLDGENKERTIDHAGSGKLCNKNADESGKSLRTSPSTTMRVGMTQKNSDHDRHPETYAKAVYSNPRPQNQNEPPKQNPFTFHERTGPNPQPQALGTTFEARVRNYMAAHTKKMERFKNAIFKQREEINDRMTEMFRLLKELTTSRTPKKVLIREEARFPITKNVNSISLTRGEEERSNKIDVATGSDIEKPTGT
ncbi:hypothetical protein Tco_1539175 [Tanacetum coccineum]